MQPTVSSILDIKDSTAIKYFMIQDGFCPTYERENDKGQEGLISGGTGTTKQHK